MNVGSDDQRLVVFGCSLTKDNYIDTWADILAKKLCLPLVNYAERGAGYTYILQKLMSVEINPTDTVVIMWPSADRFDLYANSATPHLLLDIDHASWLDGKNPALVDYQGDYNKHNGWLLNGAVPRGYKHKYYKFFYSQTLHVNLAWTNIVAAQNYLDNLKIKYVMCNSYPLLNLIQYHDDGVKDFNTSIYNKINLEKFVNNADKYGFIQLIENKKFKFFNPHYPDSPGHEWFVEDYLMPKLCE